MIDRLTYAGSGVDISKGEQAIEKIKSVVSETKIAGVLGSIGGFGGLFEPDFGSMSQPVLVSSTDGVGTKAYLAAQAQKYDTIGIDLVAMCVDDIAALGAKPLFLLDYLSVGKLEPDIAAEIVSGIAKGAKICGAALIGGEMAEHPGAMPDGSFDLAGFVVGVVEKDRIWGVDRVSQGDVLVGIDSPNLRSNGFSLARTAIFGKFADSHNVSQAEKFTELAYECCDFGNRRPIIEELLDPSVLYSPILLDLASKFEINAAAHITGGGIPGNLNRVLPTHLSAIILSSKIDVPPIFSLIEQRGGIEKAEMFKVFNMGVGMILVVSPDIAKDVIAQVGTHGRSATIIGSLVPGNGSVVVDGK